MPRYYGVTSTIPIAVDRYVDRTAARVTAASANIGVLIESPDVDSRNRVTADILGQAFNIGLSLANPIEDLRNRVTGDILSIGQNLTVLFVSPASDQRNRVTGDLTALAANIGITLNPPVFDNASRSTATVTSAATNIGVTLGSPDVDNRNRITADVQALAADIGLTFDTPGVDSRNRVTADISAAATNIGVTTESPDVDSRNRVTADISAAATNIGVTTESPDVDSRNRVTADISASATNIGLTLASPDIDQRSRTATRVNAAAANIGLDLQSPPPSDSTSFDGAMLLQRWMTDTGTGAGTPIGYYTTDYNGTLMFWFRTSDRSSSGYLGSNETIWSVARGGTDRVNIYVNDNLGTDNWIGIETDADGNTNDYQMSVTVDLFDGNVHFIAIRANSTKYDIFVDGLMNPASGPTSGLNSGRWLSLQTVDGFPVDRVNVGGFQQPNVDLFTGIIDELVHVRTALPDAELTALYNAGSGYLLAEIEASATWYDSIGAAYEMIAVASQTTWLDYTPNNIDLTLEEGTAAGDAALVVGGYTPVNDFWSSFPQLLNRYDMYVRDNIRSTGAALFTSPAINASLARTSITGLPTDNVFTMVCWYQINGNGSDTETLLMHMCVDGFSATTDGGYNGLVWKAAGSTIAAESALNADATPVASTLGGQGSGSWRFAAAVFDGPGNRQVWGSAGNGTPDITTVAVPQPNAIRLGARNDLWSARFYANADVDTPYIWTRALSDAEIEWLRDNEPDYTLLSQSLDQNNPGLTGLIFAPPLSEIGGARQDYSTSLYHLTEEDGNVSSSAGYIEELAVGEDRAIASAIAGSDAEIKRLESEVAGDLLPLGTEAWTIVMFYKTLSSASRDNTRYWLSFGDGTLQNNIEVWSDSAATYRIRFTIRNGGVANSITIPGDNTEVGQLHMLTIRRTDANTIVMSVDDNTPGTPVSSTHGVDASWKRFRIFGRNHNNVNTAYPHGMIDEVMTWHTNLSDDDVKILWEDGLGVTSRDILNDVVVLAAGKPRHAYALDSNTGDMGTDTGIGAVKIHLAPNVAMSVPDSVEGVPAGRPVEGALIRVLDSQGATDLVQNTLTQRPDLVTVPLPGEVFSQYAAGFDGTDDVIDDNGADIPSVSHPLTMILVFDSELTPGTRTLVEYPSMGLAVTTNTRLWNPGTQITSGAYPGDVKEIWVGIANTSACEFYRNDGTLATGVSADFPLNVIRIGGQAAAQFARMNGYHFSIYNGVLSNEDINTICGDKLGAELGISWVDKT